MAVSATNLDGTNDCMLRGGGLTGAADGTQFTISFWVNFNGGDGVQQAIYSAQGQYVEITKLASNRLRWRFVDTTATLAAQADTTTAMTSSTGWHHVIASIDTAVANSFYVYVDDVAEISAYNPLTSNSIDLTRTDWGVGSRTNSSLKLNACLSTIWVSHTYLDLTTTANRRNFIDASGNWVDPSAYGSPIVLLDNPFGTFQNNNGSGGNFTVTGALTDCASTPPEAGATTALIHRMRR